MERRYFVRNKEVKIEEIEGVVAVKTDPSSSPTILADDSLFRAAAPIPGIDSASLKAFEKANWRFVVTDENTSRTWAMSRHASSAAAGRLYRKGSGRVVIATDRLVVQLDPQMTDEQCRKAMEERSLRIIRKLLFAPNLYEVDGLNTRDSVDASDQLQGDPRFLLAEPSFIEPVGERAPPNDPDYPKQWHLANTGAAGGVPGADIGAESAWLTTRGAGIRVAVIDNGFDAAHQDLVGGIDAGSGYFADGGGEFIQRTQGMRVTNHGTFCAGMVGARQNNGIGCSGVAPEASLMLIGYLEDQIGTQTTLARAVAYAAVPASEQTSAPATKAADIIVCSLGPNGAVWELQDVLRLAIEFAAREGRAGRGCAIFWASSNGQNVDIALDEVVSLPDVIAVGRSSRRDLEDQSARGAKLEYLAPGVEVFSTMRGNTYGNSTGTSYAAPCAAGVAALALAVNPALSRADLRQVMISSCVKIGNLPYVNGRNDDYGHGRVSASGAVTGAMARAGQPGVAIAGAARRQPQPVLAEPDADDASTDDFFRYEIQAPSAQALREIVGSADLDLGCRPVARKVADGFALDVFATQDEIANLSARRGGGDLRVTRHQNVTANGRRLMQDDFSQSNRFAARGALPQGLGSKE